MTIAVIDFDTRYRGLFNLKDETNFLLPDYESVAGIEIPCFRGQIEISASGLDWLTATPFLYMSSTAL